MSELPLSAVVALLVGAAVWCVARAVRRAPASVGAARDRMYGRAAGELSSVGWRSTIPSVRLARWMGDHFGPGLGLIGSSPADVATKVAVTAFGCFLGTVTFMGALGAAGVLEPGLWWPVLAFGIGVLGGWTALRGVAGRVERGRRSLRQAANDFVQLVAVGLTTDQSVEEAIGFALDVGASDAFALLRHEVVTAPQRGVPVWEAIEDFGRAHDLRELREFAVCVERQGTQGVSIGETVTALAAGMRAKALDELERQADKANADLAGPTIGFVVATVVFLAYPLAQRISDAFGG